MIELRFHEELYDGAAVDEAAKTYGEYGAMDLVREAGGYVVKLTIRPEVAAEGIDELTLASEVANYALGKTIERAGGALGAAPAPGEASA